MKVSDENALKRDVIFPQKEEQIKISEYFSHLDITHMNVSEEMIPGHFLLCPSRFLAGREVYAHD